MSYIFPSLYSYFRKELRDGLLSKQSSIVEHAKITTSFSSILSSFLFLNVMIGDYTL